MPPLRIAIVGAGWVTEHHLAAYAELGGRVQIVGIADPDPQVRAERAARWGIPQTFGSDREMLDALDVDAVDVANPRQHHAASVRLAVARGLPVFCQKPLAPTLAEAQALVASLPEDARLMVHENWRFRPHYPRMRDWVAEGRIGRLRTGVLMARTSGLLPDADGRLPAVVRQPMLAGLDRMLLMEIMIHHLDALRSVVGELDLIGAILGTDTAALRGEDRATLLLRGEDGAAVSVVGDFMTHGRPPTLVDELELHGTEGAIILSGDHLRWLKGAEVVEDITLDLPADYKASYRDAIAAFLDAVRTQDPPAFRAQVEDNLRTVSLVEQAYAAPGFRSLPPPAG